VRVLVVEDDAMIGASLTRGLGDHGHAVDWIRDGAEAETVLLSSGGTYQLVLLDLALPSKDGIEVLKALRRAGDTVPVLVITARGEVDQLVTGLDHGADDYLVKPFQFAELEARMRALDRRRSGRAEPCLKTTTLTLDPALCVVQKDGNSVPLSAKEFSLLHALMLHPGAILSRAQLESRIYGWRDAIESNAVDFLLHKLRQKVGAEQIENVRGLGWRIKA
jgi:DNA-binding response OmpR family regulator